MKYLLITIVLLSLALNCPVFADTLYLAGELPAMAAVAQVEEPADVSFLEKLAEMWAKTDKRSIFIYSFESKNSSLAGLASYPAWELNDKVSLNASAVLISDNGLHLGFGPGASFKKVASIFDVVVGYSPVTKLFIGGGINDRF